jgi:hypothetical protein
MQEPATFRKGSHTNTGVLLQNVPAIITDFSGEQAHFKPRSGSTKMQKAESADNCEPGLFLNNSIITWLSISARPQTRRRVEVDADDLDPDKPPLRLTGTFVRLDGYETICKATNADGYFLKSATMRAKPQNHVVKKRDAQTMRA